MGELKASVSLSSRVVRGLTARLAVEAEGVVVGAKARRREVVKPFDVSVAPELLLRSREKWHSSRPGTWGGGARGEKGLQTPLEEGEEASRPVHSPAAGARLRRADTTEAWTGHRPRKQPPGE